MNHVDFTEAMNAAYNKQTRMSASEMISKGGPDIKSFDIRKDGPVRLADGSEWVKDVTGKEWFRWG